MVINSIPVDGKLGSRLRGYHPVAPRSLRYGPFVHRLQFRPSSPEALHVKRHEIPLLVKDRTGREMAGQCDLRFRLPRKSQRSFKCLKSATWDRRLYFPSEGRHAVDFFAQKIRRLRPCSNPRSWVPEASMLNTRPPNPQSYTGRKTQRLTIQASVDMFRHAHNLCPPISLGSVIWKTGGTEEDVASRIKKANGVFVQLYPIRRNYSTSK
jgi:hypothetical protein